MFLSELTKKKLKGQKVKFQTRLKKSHSHSIKPEERESLVPFLNLKKALQNEEEEKEFQQVIEERKEVKVLKK